MRKNRVDVITLGCSKNLVDSEHLLMQFKRNGYDVRHDPDTVDGEIVVVNTCGFIGDAKEESINMILEMVEAKKHKKIGSLYVMGCLSQRYRDELRVEIPEVDKYYGKFDWKNLLNDLGKQYYVALESGRIVTTPHHYAYVKIAEGCNRKCSYCAIPLITGAYKSRPIEDIVNEMTELVASGTKEFQVIAQDLTYYGKDLYHENKLAELIERMSDIKGVEWIRLHYAYPSHFPYEILPVINQRKNVCKYLDIALQHISDHMLTLMRRQITKEETYTLINRIRKEVPGIHIRTTLMVGHPGETEQDFDELKTFVREMRLERMGAFAYSDEEGTYANLNYEDSIPLEEKQRRLDEIMAIQEEIAEDINSQKIGKIFRVIIDREDEDYFIGRTEFDSPEIDGEVLISKGNHLLIQIGRFYNVKIIAADTFDLYGSVETDI